MSEETNQSKQNLPKMKKGNKGLIVGGMILTIGVVWLLQEMKIDLPHWIFSLGSGLLLLGLAIGVDNKFRNPASYILIIIGGVFLIDDLFNIQLSIMEYFWPLLVIFIGLMTIIRPRRKAGKLEAENPEGSALDKTDTVSVFNGVKRNIRSQRFVGGETVTIFGGTELNLLQADLDQVAHLECVVIFGGLKLIVPKNWEVRMEATTIFGGIEDKRFTAVEVVPENKTLILTGTVLFGGVDIVSY